MESVTILMPWSWKRELAGKYEAMILLLDNYDSFTYNLYQYLMILGEEIEVVRSDVVDIENIASKHPSLILISPGPGRPEDAGRSLQVVREFAGTIPILGICLGMQIIAEALGGRTVRAIEPVHGKVRVVRHGGKGLFKDIPNPMNVTRYHSLVVERSSIPAEFRVDAESEEGEIMAISHRSTPLWGVQFHPEAILTEHGLPLLANAVREASLCRACPS